MFLTRSQRTNGASHRKTSNICMPIICYGLTITNIKLSISIEIWFQKHWVRLLNIFQKSKAFLIDSKQCEFKELTILVIYLNVLLSCV